MRRLLLTFAAIATAIFAMPATPVAAAPVIVTNIAMNTPPDIVKLNGGIFNGDVYMGPTTLTFSDASTALVYCVDIWHSSTLGAQMPPLVYQTTTLAAYLTGLGYSSAIQQQIAGLVYLGLTMPFGPQQNAFDGGIWQKEGGTVTAGSPALQAQINAYGSSVFTYDPTKIIAYTHGTGQTYAGLLMPVPEPATWALLIVGFGVIGVTMRRRSRTSANGTTHQYSSFA